MCSIYKIQQMMLPGPDVAGRNWYILTGMMCFDVPCCIAVVLAFGECAPITA